MSLKLEQKKPKNVFLGQKETIFIVSFLNIDRRKNTFFYKIIKEEPNNDKWLLYI